jgi:hypothetical protein
MRIGPCFDKPCAPLLSADGLAFATVTELRYLGVTLLSGRSFRVSMARARRSFCRAANCILGRLQGLASEETIFYLIRTKALPSLLYATEATCLQRSEISSLDFTVVRFAMKILKTSNKDIVLGCLSAFGFAIPSYIISVRKSKFELKLKNTANSVCSMAAALRL